VAQCQLEYDEVKEEQDQLMAQKKRSKAKKLDKKLIPLKTALDQARGRLTGLEGAHENERVDRVEQMMEERKQREKDARKEELERQKQLDELSQAQQSRLTGQCPEQHKQEVLPALEQARCARELTERVKVEIDRLRLIRSDLDKKRVGHVIKLMKQEHEAQQEKIWAGQVARYVTQGKAIRSNSNKMTLMVFMFFFPCRRGYTSIKLSLAAMAMQKIIRAHAGEKTTLCLWTTLLKQLYLSFHYRPQISSERDSKAQAGGTGGMDGRRMIMAIYLPSPSLQLPGVFFSLYM